MEKNNNLLNISSNNYNNNNCFIKRKYLNYIAFIKFWAMLLIIKWHIIPYKIIKIDYGARMCEILFISSGFLIGYNYYKRPMPPTYHSSFKYVYKHLRNFYPLELINIIYGIYLYNKKLDLTCIQILIVNILLINSWSRYTKLVSCFNNRISWFLSALLFCYFLTPFLLGGIKNIKNSIILFLLVSFIRIYIQIIIAKGALNILDIYFHTGPIIRCMEFYLGMLTIPLFFKFNLFLDKFKNKLWIKILFTAAQIIFPFGIYYFMLYFNFILARCYFVLVFCLFIFIFGYEYGLLSNFFEMRISRIIMSYQLEMYLLQDTVNKTLSKIMIKIHLKFPSNLGIQYYIKLVIIFIMALIYKNLFKEKLAKSMDMIVYLIKNIFN